jgi:PD-(D/E)XK nuclease superfamily protein
MIEEMERMPLRALTKRGRGRRRIVPKRLGEVGEAAFLPKMLYVGYGVAKPWGDSDAYDYILDSGWKRWRTQVKCTASRLGEGYHVQPIHHLQGKARTLYTADDIDLLVVYIVPCDSWYVFPIESILGVKNLVLYPDGEHHRAKWERHREAWHLLHEPCPQHDACPEQDLCQGLKDWRKCFLQGIRTDPDFIDLMTKEE